MSIRSTAKAIIVKDGKVLLNECFDKNNGNYYSLPGGGQNQYETLQEAVVRECLEETGYTVNLVRFAALCEEICLNEDFRKKHPDYGHKMYHIFICEVCDEIIKPPVEKDSMQIDSKWIDISLLNDIHLMPNIIGKNIINIINCGIPLFLGSEQIDFNHG